MGNRFSRKSASLTVLLLTGLAISQVFGLAQEAIEKAGRKAALGKAPASAASLETGLSVSRLGRKLRRYRMIGDLENAGRLFGRLFPAEGASDPETAIKLAAARPSSRIEAGAEIAKAIAEDDETCPVLFSPEHEKNPTADTWQPASGAPVIFLAAEQWAGGWPKDIRVRKSSDNGLTWPDTMVIGDERPWTRPSLRRISDHAAGLAFVKDWDGRERDIWFARLSEDLASDSEFPVALSSLDQSAPSLATDFSVFSAPYVYVAYAESAGPVRSVKLRVSEDLGASWSRAVTIASFPGRDGFDADTAIVFDPETGRLHIAYTCPQGLADRIAVATSSDFGVTWSRPAFVTPAGDRQDLSPKIAAKGGTVLIVYERTDGASGRHIGFAYSSDSGREWTTNGRLGPAQAAANSPDVRASDKPDSTKFFASYVEDDARIVVASCEASDPASWTTEKAFSEGAAVVDGGPVIVLPMTDPQGGEPAGAVWSGRNPDYDVYFGLAGIGNTSPDGVLSLLPTSGLSSSGPVGGPFTPAKISYTLRNAGGAPLVWTAANTTAWVTLSATSGALGPGESTTVEVAINESANALPADAYSDSVSFTNITNGSGTTTRTVVLPVSLAAMTVTPANRDVPYTAGTTTFTVAKTGSGRIIWIASVISGGAWLSIQSGVAGTNAGTITAAFTENPASTARVGTIRVTPLDLVNPSVDVTVTQAGRPLLVVTPADGLASSGTQGGPFSPAAKDYTLLNNGSTDVSWTAAATETWVTVSPASGTLSAGASTTVSVSINAEANSLAAGNFSDTVTIANGEGGAVITTRPVSLTVTVAAGALAVTPADGLTSSGIKGGPFTPPSKAYTLQNPGGTSISWTAAATQAWVTASPPSGTLAAKASTTVTVSINTEANALVDGTYSDAVTFANETNGSGSTTRPVSLTVSATPGTLSVTPAEGLASSGLKGGPFAPASQTYTLQNTGGAAISWAAAHTETWVTLSATSGGLAAGASTTVAVSINNWANALSAGTFNDTVSFTNATNGNGDTTRPVTLTVSVGPVLSVTPDNRDVTSAAGTTTFEVANTGGGTMAWTASVVAGGDWLSLQGGQSGTGGGTITAGFTANRTASSRVSVIRITAAGAAGSPSDVTVTQEKGSISLELSAQRLIEKAWIIRREFGRLTIAVTNPASIPVDKYVIYRKAGNLGFQVLKEIAGSSVDGTGWTYDDAFLQSGTSYTYRVVALDALGGVIGESNDDTI